MNYELAKQLKDAGFPQEGEGKYFGMVDVNARHYIPTLSELIEACGDDFMALNKSGQDTKYKGNWLAQRCITCPDEFYEGKTPEESVAKLYLELHKK